MDESIIRAEDLTLGYRKSIVIKSANFAIKKQDFVFITGVSGSGKSTLLRSMYGALRAESGNLRVCGFDLVRAKKAQIAALRREIGIVFQDYKLIKEWSIEKNIAFPMKFNPKILNDKTPIHTRTQALLKHVKLIHKANKLPMQLSGGEQQRAALARAIAHAPSVIFADEPTGNLDDFSSDIIWNLLLAAKNQLQATIIVVTHRLPNLDGFRHLHIEDSHVSEIN